MNLNRKFRTYIFMAVTDRFGQISHKKNGRQKSKTSGSNKLKEKFRNSIFS